MSKTTTFVVTSDKETKNTRRFTTAATEGQDSPFSGSLYVPKDRTAPTLTVTVKDAPTKTSVTLTKDKDTKSGVRFTTAATEGQDAAINGSLYVTTEQIEALQAEDVLHIEVA